MHLASKLVRVKAIPAWLPHPSARDSRATLAFACLSLRDVEAVSGMRMSSASTAQFTMSPRSDSTRYVHVLISALLSFHSRHISCCLGTHPFFADGAHLEMTHKMLQTSDLSPVASLSALIYPSPAYPAFKLLARLYLCEIALGYCPC